MPGCCVDGCKNRSEKGFQLFRLPTGKNNSERHKEWLKLIEKDTLSARAVICKVHFDGDRQFKGGRQDERKLLCPYATFNLLRKCIAEEKKAKDNCECDTTNTNGNNSGINVNSINTELEIIHTEATHAEISSIEATHTETNSIEEVNVETNNTEATDETTYINTTSSKISDKEHIRQLKRKLKKILRQCNLLNRKL